MNYRLRVSPWVRRLSLRVTLEGTIEITSPRRIGRRAITQVLAQEQGWIQAALAEVGARRATLPPPPAWTVPPTIALPAVGTAWTLTLHPTGARGVRALSDGDGRLILAGQVGETALCRVALRRWLLHAARAHLLPRLEALSHAASLPYSRATVRLARSRWGSCARTGAIALSARLLFLPPALVDYVLTHELCHTRELNHSPTFWALVARHCPAYREHRRALRAAGKRLPQWIEDLR